MTRGIVYVPDAAAGIRTTGSIYPPTAESLYKVLLGRVRVSCIVIDIKTRDSILDAIVRSHMARFASQSPYMIFLNTVDQELTRVRQHLHLGRFVAKDWAVPTPPIEASRSRIVYSGVGLRDAVAIAWTGPFGGSFGQCAPSHVNSRFGLITDQKMDDADCLTTLMECAYSDRNNSLYQLPVHYAAIVARYVCEEGGVLAMWSDPHAAKYDQRVALMVRQADLDPAIVDLL